jgi:hypothetical protein
MVVWSAVSPVSSFLTIALLQSCIELIKKSKFENGSIAPYFFNIKSVSSS